MKIRKVLLALIMLLGFSSQRVVIVAAEKVELCYFDADTEEIVCVFEEIDPPMTPRGGELHWDD